MKKGDMIIDHENDYDDDKIGIILEVSQSDDNSLTYLDVLYPSGVYEVEIPKGERSGLEVICKSVI